MPSIPFSWKILLYEHVIRRYMPIPLLPGAACLPSFHGWVSLLFWRLCACLSLHWREDSLPAISIGLFYRDAAAFAVRTRNEGLEEVMRSGGKAVLQDYLCLLGRRMSVSLANSLLGLLVISLSTAAHGIAMLRCSTFLNYTICHRLYLSLVPSYLTTIQRFSMALVWRFVARSLPPICETSIYRRRGCLLGGGGHRSSFCLLWARMEA